MTDVVNIETYIRRSESAAPTPAQIGSGHEWASNEPQYQGTLLNVAALQRLQPDTQLSRFLSIASRALAQAEVCDENIRAKDALGADDALMATKSVLEELLMYRDISDSVGLIAFKCFDATCKISMATDAPGLPTAVKRALQRIWSAPFMPFDEACKLADSIEESVGSLEVVGYAEIAAELIGDATVTDQK